MSTRAAVVVGINYTSLAPSLAGDPAAAGPPLRLAEADAQSNTKRAEGEKSLKMVDVNVEREKVNVEKARVDVERVSLSNKQEFEGAALQFELEKLRIQADKEVRIAAAQAMANMFAKAQMQIFGDPSTMASMQQQFMKAAGYGQAADGLMQTLPPEAKTLLANLGTTIVSQMAAKKPDGKGSAVEAKPEPPKPAPPPSPEELHRG